MIKSRTAILALLTGLNLLNYIDRMIVAAVLRKIQAPVAEGGLALSNLQGGLLATALRLIINHSFNKSPIHFTKYYRVT